MSYFSKFPRTVITRNNTPFIIRDFLSRVAVSENFKKQYSFLENYFILDGETPESVSFKLYGSPTYHWVLLMINDILDPRNDWPVSERKIMDVTFMKYDYIITVPSAAAYTVGDMLTSSNGGKFEVMSKTGSNIYIRSNSGFIVLTTSVTMNNVTTSTTGLVISAVTRPDTRVHHYYDTVLEYIVDYDGSNPNIIPVTNYEYEVELNDAKRNIKIISEDLLPVFVKEFDNRIGA